MTMSTIDEDLATLGETLGDELHSEHEAFEALTRIRAALGGRDAALRLEKTRIAMMSDAADMREDDLEALRMQNGKLLTENRSGGGPLDEWGIPKERDNAMADVIWRELTGRGCAQAVPAARCVARVQGDSWLI